MSDDNMDRDWYKELFNLMDEKLRGPDAYLDFKENNVDFITFNYDRSLEHFLYDSLISTYGSIDLNVHKPLDLIPFKFIHVYGKIDNFPWEEPPGFEYRKEYHVRDIFRVADNIKLIHERDDEFLNEIKKLISDAKNIFFLGFGYDEDNMKALGWPEIFNENHRIFGTAYKRNDDDIDAKVEMLVEGFPKKSSSMTNIFTPLIENADCLSLISKYKKFLYS
jgi:hypothetical protein